MVINRLQELRWKASLSQKELAEKSGVARSTISEIELGKYLPNVEIALKLAAALGRPVGVIFALKEDE